MSFSVGIDIEEVRRFQSLIRNRRFIERVFTPEEIAYCSSKKNKAQHFAVRFAAKEAVWKAVNEALPKNRKGLGHQDIGLENAASGKPHVYLRGAYSKMSKKISVSLSHTTSHAVAVALFQR